MIPHSSRWRRIPFTRVVFRFEFEPRDLWLGVYWNWQVLPLADVLDVYVCLLPTLPIRFRRFFNQAKAADRA